MASALDQLRTQIQDAEPLLKQLDTEIEQIQFDPVVAGSVEAARVAVGTLIEGLMGQFKDNPILGPLMIDLEAQYLDGIQAAVAEATLR